MSSTLTTNEVYAIGLISNLVSVFDIDNFKIREVQSSPTNINDNKSKFDLLIINNLSLEIEYGENLVGFFRRHLQPDAQIILLESNPGFLKNVFKSPFQVLSAVLGESRSARLKRLFTARHIRKYETISYEDAPFEAFSPGHYYSNKNNFLISEKVKRILLNTRFSRVLYNSTIWIVSMGNNRVDFVDECIKTVSTHSAFDWQGHEIKLLKIYFKYGKMLISLTTQNSRKPEYVLVFPMDSETLARRENEQKIVEQLADVIVGEDLLLPKVVKGFIGQLQYFAMKEIPGITVDMGNSRIEEMTFNAFKTIERITSRLKSDNSPDTDFRLLLIEDYLQTLVDRYPSIEQFIEQIYPIKNHIEALPLVNFFHGDLKLENFLVDEDTSRINGIIDFEQSEIPGPAFLDLLYLIAYSYETVEHETFEEAYRRLSENDLNDFYQGMIDDYCASFDISEQQRCICLVVFYIHHYAKRIFFRVEIEGEMQEFANCMSYATSLMTKIQ